MRQKIWVYPLATNLSEPIADKISREISGFLAMWDTHGVPVDGGLKILGNKIIMISLNSEEVIPSGCAKDKLDNSIRQICLNNGITVLDESNLIIKKSDLSFEVLNRLELKALLNSGDLGLETLLLDYSCLGNEETDLNNVFRPIKDTWAFKLKNKPIEEKQNGI